VAIVTVSALFKTYSAIARRQVLMLAEHKVASLHTEGNNDTERRLHADVKSYRHEVIGGRVLSILTGRPVYVLSPPDDPKPERNPELTEEEDKIEAVLQAAHDAKQEAVNAFKRLGDAMLAETAQLEVPDDISSLDGEFAMMDTRTR
jgi:hypothetical protein